MSSGSAMSTTQALKRIIVNANPTSGLVGSLTLTLDNTATSDGGLLDSRTIATTTAGVDVSLRGASAAAASVHLSSVALLLGKQPAARHLHAHGKPRKLVVCC
jgi:hypothetical protein